MFMEGAFNEVSSKGEHNIPVSDGSRSLSAHLTRMGQVTREISESQGAATAASALSSLAQRRINRAAIRTKHFARHNA